MARALRAVRTSFPPRVLLHARPGDNPSLDSTAPSHRGAGRAAYRGVSAVVRSVCEAGLPQRVSGSQGSLHLDRRPAPVPPAVVGRRSDRGCGPAGVAQGVRGFPALPDRGPCAEVERGRAVGKLRSGGATLLSRRVRKVLDGPFKCPRDGSRGGRHRNGVASGLGASLWALEEPRGVVAPGGAGVATDTGKGDGRWRETRTTREWTSPRHRV